MRILILTLCYWPDSTGIAVFARGRAEYLASRGHEVVVCCGMPFYPQWRIADGYRRRMVIRENHAGVSILRTWLYVPKRASSARRIVHEASFAAGSLLRSVGSSRPDLILVISPPLPLGMVAAILGRIWKIPYVFHVADLQPDAALDLGMLSEGTLTKSLLWLERFTYRNAALVSTLTERMRERIVEKGFSPDHVVIFSDWAEPSLFELPLTGGHRFRSTYGLDGHFLVLHAGNMGVKQGLDVVLSAADLTRDRDDIKYLLVGDGAAGAHLRARARALQLPNVLFLPLQEQDMFAEMIAAADVGLITQLASVADIVFPSKTLSLLAAARPVIASLSGDSEVSRVIADSQAGMITPAEDAKALRNAVLQLQANAKRRAVMAAAGRDYARRHWDKTRILTQFEERLLGLVARGKDTFVNHSLNVTNGTDHIEKVSSGS